MVDQRRFDDQRWVESRAAAKLLGIQLRTLYAYVSRGAVRSVAASRGRPRLYALADLERLRLRRDARAGHGPVAAGALRWGEPVLDSAITAITPRGPAYRGHVAIDLAADGVPFERVAELLWSGVLPAGHVVWPRPAVSAARLGRLVSGVGPLDAMALAIPLAALDDPGRADPRPDTMVERGRRLIALLAACLALDPGWPVTAAAATASFARALGAGTIAEIAARALGHPGDPDVVAALDVALVVLADHELNASSFAARVTASTGADPYACVASALATVSGPRHGRASEEISRLADDIGAPEDVRGALKQARALPHGFGHPLYASGDPRTAPLLALARARPNPSRRTRTLLALADAGDPTASGRRAAILPPPSCDVALAALIASLGAPPSAASALFAVSRCAGWLAHALEQRSGGELLRPRARYVGVPVIARATRAT